MTDLLEPFTLLLALVGGYVAGSIPFGLMLTRAAGLGDVRRIGSGNIGATNVLRTGNKPLALATFLLDAGKGAAPVLLAGTLADPLDSALAAVAAGVAAVVGHNFPVWLRFKGGKGVATTLGVLTALAWPAGLITALIWLLVAVVFRYSSLAALVALALSPLGMLWFSDDPTPALAATLLATLAVLRHQDNIRRLVAGTEPKIGDRRDGGRPKG